MSETMQFRLLRGQHVEGVKGPDGRPLIDPQDGSKVERVYNAGDVIETTVDLAARFNHPECVEQKFERLIGGLSAASLDPDTHEVWDRTRETLDQFCQRVRKQEGRSPVSVAAEIGAGVVTSVTHGPSTSAAAVPDKPGYDAVTKPLTQMTLKELQTLAAEEEIDISKCRNQQDTLRVVREAMASVPTSH